MEHSFRDAGASSPDTSATQLTGDEIAARLTQQAGTPDAFRAQTDAALQEVVGRLEGVRGDARSTAAATGLAMDQVIASAQGTLTTAVARERAAFETAVTTTSTEALTWGQQAGQRAQQVVTGVQTQAKALGSTYGGKAQQAEQNAIAAKNAEAAALGAEAVALGEQKAGSAGGGEEAANAKGKAARELASKASTTIVDGVSTALDGVKVADQLAAQWAAEALAFADSLNGAADPATKALGEAGQGMAEAVQKASLEGNTTLAEVEGQASTVATQGGQWATQLQDRAQEAVAQLDQVEEQLRTAHDQANTAAAAGFTQAIGEAAQGASGVTATPEEVDAIVGEMQGKLQADQQTAGAQVATELTAHGDAVVEQVGQVPDALTQDGQAAADAVSEGITAVETGLAEQGQQATGAMTGALGQVRSAGDGAVTQMGTELDGSVANVENELKGHLATFEGGLEERLAPAMEQARGPLDALPGQIDQAFGKVDAQLAEVEEQEGGLFGWLGRQFSSLWDIVSDPGFIAGALAGIALAALAIVLAPVEIGVLAIVGIGAAIAAVAAVVGTVVHNAFQGKSGLALFDGALQAALVGGLFGGAAALITALLGIGTAAVAVLTATTAVLTVLTNLATGQPWDQNLLANTLMAGFGAWLAGRLARLGKAPRDVVPDDVAEGPVLDAPDAPEQPATTSKRPPRPGSEEAPLDASGKVAERSDGSFRLNRKDVENAHKIDGEPEATNAVDANREVAAAELAATRANVEKVIMGEQADALINNGRTGETMSADVVGITKNNKFTVSEAKGGNIEHGLEQLQHSGNALGPEQVTRYDLVVPERINTPGYTVENGLLMEGGQPKMINGKPVHVTFTTQ